MDSVLVTVMLDPEQTRAALQRAVAATKSIYVLADRIGVTYQAIQKWLRSGIVPPRRVLAVEKAARFRVKRWELRPDLYPPPPRIARAAQTNTTAPA